MKIIFLNTWGGRVTEPLLKFFKENQDVDVFCLQEVWSGALVSSIDQGELPDLFSEIGDVLSSYKKVFAPADSDGDYGLAIYFKKKLFAIDDRNIIIHDKEEYFPGLKFAAPRRNLQYITLQTEDHQKLTIANFHGLWSDQGKNDSEDRLLQSEKIIEFLKNLKDPVVLGGDFNLNPGTESIKKFEDFGLRNLVVEHGVTTTRTPFCTKKDKFADYIFVSRGITVQDFKVLPDEVSDHAPLCVTITL